MQFEDFDNKVRQAADQHHPNYDENAWANMQKMLDQHLPVKKDRDRRIIFLLLLFFLLGGGAWVIFSKPWQQENTIASVSKDSDKAVAKSPAATPKDVTEKPAISTTPAENTGAGEAVSIQPERNNTTANPNIVADNKNQVTVSGAPDKGQRKNDKVESVAGKGKVNNAPLKQNKAPRGTSNKNDRSAMVIAAPVNTRKGNDAVSGNQGVSVPTSNNNDGKASDVATKKDDVKTQTSQTPPADNEVNSKTEEQKKDKTAETATTDKKDIARKASNKKNNYLFFSFGVAPDLSYISLDDPGKVKLLAGAGFGYSFNNKWTIRTGFYAGSKIYTANKYNYKPDNPGPTTYLDKIDADCKVYEVPLSIAYNFSKAEKHSFFGSMGLSSFFMKKEEYQYLYKYPGPPPTTYTHTKEVYNENKHYFSVLTLSAGYGRRLNNTFSVSAEPYVKLPLAGIGYGHVKLNSMGVLFSVNVAPFHH